LRARPVAFKAAIAKKLYRHVWPLFAEKRLRPIIHEVFPAQEAARAHALMESGAHIGKIVLRWQ
jgi:NADPH:quinone reductase